MRLRVLFCHYDPDDDTIMPNAIAVTDDYMEDAFGGTPDYYGDAIDGGHGGGRLVEAYIDVPDSEVLALFATRSLRASSSPRAVEGEGTDQ